MAATHPLVTERSRTMVRVSPETHEALKALADETGDSMQAIVGKAVEAYRRQRIIDGTLAAYAALRTDRDAWQELRAEDGEWDATLADGLDDE